MRYLKYFIAITCTAFIAVFASANGNNLWEHFGGRLPSISERALVYEEIGFDEYEGTAEQNAELLLYFHAAEPLGALAFPPSTVEGTSTAGWTDDGSIVRLNTSSDSVGIGTSNPAEKLTVSGGNLLVSGSGQVGTTFYSLGDLFVSGGDINLGTGSATSTLTSASGRLGVGTTSPTRTFSVHGEIYSTGTTTTGVLVVASSTTNINGVQNTWPSTQGAVDSRLTNNGSGGLSWAVAAAGSATGTSFTTTGTSTWQVPTGITRVKVTLVGGGGGGGGSPNDTGRGGGGGGGAYAEAWVDVTADTGIQFFVGLGGNAGPASTNGLSGSSTVFFATSTRVTAGGGTGGDAGSGASNGNGGSGGTATNGGFSISGEAGWNGGAAPCGITTAGGGDGGQTYTGKGGCGANAGAGNAPRWGRGGGGGGGGLNAAGGAGASGFLKIEWIES